MNQEKLFEIEKSKPESVCRLCVFRQVLNYSNTSFSYCIKQKSGRTENGLKKIKAKDPSCGLFKPGKGPIQYMH